MKKTWKNFLKSLQKGAGWSWKAFELLTENQYRFRSVLNGLIGDTLEAKKSRLAIEMSFRGEIHGGKICVLVHGLCDSEETWGFTADAAKNYGTLLQQDFGYTPVFLRYNSGLHISTNGQLLAKLLREIDEENPDAIQEILLIGHSMGGLVVRSACHYGQKKGAAWVKRVKKIFLLGTPHLGSDWEKLGHLTGTILKKIPNFVTKGIAVLGDKRSAGIKDLRWGYLLDEDWRHAKADSFWKDNRHPVPLLKGVDYYLIAAALAKKADHFLAQYFGDGAVPFKSAAGRSFRKSKCIPFSPDRCKTIRGLSHTGLARHPQVYEQIREWLR
jgi:pimeloyl-ACP methyl ester carboxylesterase